MSQYQASPQEGHLEGLYLIFHYLSKNPKKRLVMDPHYPDVDEDTFNVAADWVQFYGDLFEEEPPMMPQPLGVLPQIDPHRTIPNQQQHCKYLCQHLGSVNPSQASF